MRRTAAITILTATFTCIAGTIAPATAVACRSVAAQSCIAA